MIILEKTSRFYTFNLLDNSLDFISITIVNDLKPIYNVTVPFTDNTLYKIICQQLINVDKYLTQFEELDVEEIIKSLNKQQSFVEYGNEYHIIMTINFKYMNYIDDSCNIARYNGKTINKKLI